VCLFENKCISSAGAYLIGLGPFDLGPEVLDALVQAAVAAQVGLHGGQVGAPLRLVDAPLVLLHPGQQVLGVAQRDVVQLGPRLGGGLLQLHGLRLDDGDGRLLPQVVVAAQVHQALVEPVNPAGSYKTTTIYIYI